MAGPHTRSQTNENQEAQSNAETVRAGTPLTMEAFLQAVQILGQRQAREHVPQPQQQPRPQNTIVEFKKLSPPAFSGTTDPLEAEKWLTEIEKTFSVLQCSDIDKVSHAAYMLQGDAHDWWLMVKRQHEDNTTPFTWKMFQDAFYTKYFPKSVRQEKEKEFIQLKQHNKTVADYEAEFARLAKFAPAMVTTEESRVRRFEEGLMPRIKEQVIPFELTKYGDVVSKALLVESTQRATKEQNKAQDGGTSYGGFGEKSGKDKGHNQKRKHDHNESNESRNEQGKQQRTTCPKCGKEHLGECRLGTNVCYKCGKPGHRIRECQEGQKYSN